MDAKLLGLVQESIARFVGSPVGTIGKLSTQKIYDADRSIFRVRAENCPTIFALKVRKVQAEKEGDLSDSASESEFRKIEAAFAVIRNTSFAADMPVPVELYPDHRAILTTWCPGTELRRLFYRGAKPWSKPSEDLVSHFDCCGKWLAAFHDGSRRDTALAETTEVRLRHLDRMLAQLADNPRNRLGDPRLEKVKVFIGQSLLNCDRVDVGLVHGNFTLRNILCSSGRAVPVDFEDGRRDAISMDVGQFVADVALSAYRPRIGSSACTGAIAAFLAAYRAHVPISQERLEGSFLYHILATYYEVVGRNPSAIPARLISSRQRTVYSQMLSAPERTCTSLLGEAKRF